LEQVEREIQEDYIRLHKEAQDDRQRAGHGGEATWAGVLRSWLPSNYEIGTRKYILPEQGEDGFEMDLVVFSPGYPMRLRGREEIMAGGVAAAFSVRLTLDSSGVKDGVERAARLRRQMKPRTGSPKEEIVGAFPVGLLAHSHNWKAPGSTPVDNVTGGLLSSDLVAARHPRETLDFLCVADLASYTTKRTPFIPPDVAVLLPAATAHQKTNGCAMSAILMSDTDRSPTPVAVLIAALLGALSRSDPTLRPFADALRLTGTLGAGQGEVRLWNLEDVYTEDARRRIGLQPFAWDVP
jgi:hypothetical protein